MSGRKRTRKLWVLVVAAGIAWGAFAWAQSSTPVKLGVPSTAAPSAAGDGAAAGPDPVEDIPLAPNPLSRARSNMLEGVPAEGMPILRKAGDPEIEREKTAAGAVPASSVGIELLPAPQARKPAVLPPALGPEPVAKGTAESGGNSKSAALAQKGGPTEGGLKGPKVEGPSPEEGLRPPALRPSSAAAKGPGYSQRAQFGSKTRTYREEMTKVGLFWWRDNTKEIKGREEKYIPDMPPQERRISEGVTFGDGLFWRSKDEYFTLTFHDLTQLDMREPIQQGDPLHGGFAIPRQRWYFQGKVGDYADFVTSVNRGYSTLDILDSFVDFVVNREWLKFRVGHFKMPSQYEYAEIAEGDLIGPERSLFVANYAANRQLGAVAQGYLLDRRIRYYAGVGSGPRRSFEDFNSGRDYFFYLDYRPFYTWDGFFLKNLHLVGTYNFGEERNPLAPFALRTMNQLSGSETAAFVSPTILEFNNNVFENGPRAFWGFEPVWYYKSFGFLGSLQGGYQCYSGGNLNPFPNRQNSKAEFLGVGSPNQVHVPINGWSVGGWYFITGEEITARRFLVEPRRPFGYYNGTINPGAIELFSHFSNLSLGSNIFTSGLVDPALWTNRANAIDAGFNWYLNHYVKFTFDYQHTFLGGPVILNPNSGRKTSSYDMFLFRTQLYF